MFDEVEQLLVTTPLANFSNQHLSNIAWSFAFFRRPGNVSFSLSPALVFFSLFPPFCLSPRAPAPLFMATRVSCGAPFCRRFRV